MDAEAGLTSTGMAVGTPEYMAPEQAAGAPAGPAADIYALGAMLYQLLTGQPPFRGDTPAEVLQALTFAEPVAPRRFRPRLPRDLETIALKAIEKEPTRRYPTAEAMAEDLRRFLAGEPIWAQPLRVWERIAKWARRRPAQAVLSTALAAVIVLSLVGITALWIEAAAARDHARVAAAVANSAATEARRRSDDERRARYRAGIAAAASALALNNFDSARRNLKRPRRNTATGSGGTSPRSSTTPRPGSGPLTGPSARSSWRRRAIGSPMSWLAAVSSGSGSRVPTTISPWSRSREGK